MLGPAGILVKIKPGVDYTKESVEDKLPLIFSIHCIKTNQCIVKIKTQGDSEIEFPPGSFVAGAVYHIYIRSMQFDENLAGFIGYRLLKNSN